MSKISAIIPAYNVEKTISQVIYGVNQFIDLHDIIVIDDGSIDATGEKIKKTGVVLLKNISNKGKGFSLKKGYQYVVKKKYQAAICLDADLQHVPEDIPKFLDSFKKNNVDLILGSRMHDVSTMPWDRQFSNQTTSLLISLFTGLRVRDSQSGYRLIKTDVLRKINLVSNKYETESELLVKALKNKFKICHVPIRTIYNDQPSHINRFVDAWRFVKIVMRSLIRKA